MTASVFCHHRTARLGMIIATIFLLMMQPMRYVHCVIKEYMYQLFLWEMMRRSIAQKRYIEKNLQEYVVLMSWQRRQEDLYKKRFSR